MGNSSLTFCLSKNSDKLFRLADEIFRLADEIFRLGDEISSGVFAKVMLKRAYWPERVGKGLDRPTFTPGCN